MESDPQVLATRQFVESKSLLDVLLSKYDTTSKNPSDPFLLRVLLCGKIGRTANLEGLQALSDEACRKADVANLFCDEGTNTDENRSLTIKYGEHFVQLVEGSEGHIFSYMSELEAKLNSLEIQDTCVLFLDDDVDSTVCNKWIYVSKIPPLAELSGALEKNEEEIEESALADLHNVLELAAHGKNDSKGNPFSEAAKKDFPRLFPREDMLAVYLKCGLFLTLKEYVETFCKFPDFTRDGEVSHPAEDPLKF